MKGGAQAKPPQPLPRLARKNAAPAATPADGQVETGRSPDSAGEAARQQGMGNAVLSAANDTGGAPPPPSPEDRAQQAAPAQAQGSDRGAGPGAEAAEGEKPPGAAAGGGAAPEAQDNGKIEEGGDAAASESEAIRILGRALPSQASEALRSARDSAESEVDADRQALKDHPPTREAPSGLRSGQGKKAGEAAGGETGGAKKAPSIEEQPGEGGEPKEPESEHEPAQGPVQTGASPDAIVSSLPEDPVQKVRAIQRQLWATPASDEVDTSAGPRPALELTGEADPGRYDEQANENARTLSARRTTATAEMQVDEGVDDIYPTLPDEMLSVQIDAGESALPEMPAEPMQELSPDLKSGLDKGAATKWNAEIGKQASGHKQATLDRRSAETEKRAETERQIAEAEGMTVEEQLAARATAHEEVAGARATWRGELDQARTTYNGENMRVRGQLASDVDARVAQANEEADGHLKEGERKAEAEKVRVESEADQRKAEAERKRQEADGFFDWVVSRVKSFFAALKRRLKLLFDGLRKAVKVLIEGAKKLANAAIELGRRAVVGMIRVAGRALEKACDVFLAAFPEARDRAKALIRKGTDKAEQAVNAAAEWLRKKVNALLDALGKALLFIIEVYERFYTALLEAVEALVLGMLELARGLYRLGLAASYSPGQFFGQVQEEMIGADLTQPLPFELTDAERAQLEAEAAGADGAVAMPDPADFEGDQAMAAAAMPMSLEEGQVEVEPVAGFAPDPELVQSLALADGEGLEFGENAAPENTLEGWQDAMMGGAIAEAGGASEAAPAAGAEEPAAALSTEERLQQLMAQEPDHTCQTETPKGPEGPAIPLAAKFGPLTVGQRGRYLMAKAWQGIKQWFKCNWGKVLLAVLGVLAVIAAIVVAAVLSGGTVLGALGAIFSVLGPVIGGAMVVVAIASVLNYLGQWVVKSWSGDIIGGAKNLARAVAVGAVEIIFAVLTYLTGGLFRLLTASLKGAGRLAKAGAKAAARLAARTAKATGKALGRGGKALAKVSRKVAPRTTRFLIRGGKVIVRGVRGTVGRGAKSLRDLGRKLGQRFRFRKFKIERQGRWFRILGQINPWVLLATGEVRYVKDADVAPLPAGKTTVKVGPTGRKGIVLGQNEKASRLVRNVQDIEAAAPRKRLMRALRGESPGDVKTVLRSKKALGEASSLFTKESVTVGKNAADWFRNPRGELVKTKAKLQQVFKKAKRSSAERTAQARVGKSGGVAGDQGGHVVGHRFMPDQGDVNMFAQAGHFNNSAWKKLENEWADWIGHKGFHVEVEVNFSHFNAAKRPGRMKVKYKVIDPATSKVVYAPGAPIPFDNLPYQIYKRVAKSAM